MTSQLFVKLFEKHKALKEDEKSMSNGTVKEANEDRRVDAFCSNQGPEIFRSIAFPADVWLPDPLDVEAIHSHARDAFRQLLSRATDQEMLGKVGQLLLLLGEAGSGKTHLMRAFRTYAHRGGSAYFGYMQMTTSSGNYGRYVLRKLIESLDTPYFNTPANRDSTTGLQRLSRAVSESPAIPKKQVVQLRENDLSFDESAMLVLEMAEHAVCDPRLRDVPMDLIIAMLFLQSDHPALRNRVMKYLRAEALSEFDRQRLAGITSLDPEDGPQMMIERLGQLMWNVQGASLILCLDQLEDIAIHDGAAEQFPRAMNCLIRIASQVPSTLVVVSCLEDYYVALKQHLDRSALDRIEKDPPPLKLQSGRTLNEIKEIVSLHLSHLYDHFDVAIDNDSPTFPMPEALLEKYVRSTSRTVLSECKAYRDQCIREHQLLKPNDDAVVLPDPATNQQRDQDRVKLDQAWNDFVVNTDQALPDDDEGLATLLARSIDHCNDEIAIGDSFTVDVDQLWITVRLGAATKSSPHRIVSICNKTPSGGYLGKQIKAVVDHATEQVPPVIPVVVRNSEYIPKNPRALITKRFAELVTCGGTSVVIPDSAWRAMAAMAEFRIQHKETPGFGDWLCHAMPLSRLASLRQILDLETLEKNSRRPLTESSAPVTQPNAGERLAPNRETTCVAKKQSDAEVDDTHTSARTPDVPKGHLMVGRSRSREQSPVMIQTRELTKHVAFLGSTGSGKTTAALNVIEQLIIQGVPTLLVDRKGDLVSYAREDIWNEHADSPSLEQRRCLLRERLDVAVYTPGHTGGRAIRLPIAPDRLGDMNEADLKLTAATAARSVGDMLGYKEVGRGGKHICVMIQAIELMARLGYETITLDALIEYINERDDALVSALGVLDVKVINSLLQDLQTLLINKQHLFPSDGEPLCAEELLGLNGATPSGRTRLSVISTKFLGDHANVQFWVSQLLLELTRWANKSPSKELQAAVLFDEADLYLPAVSKPACKEPMEGLLKRARSAGLCVMLASQSPGDFDYKSRENINTWFVGKIKEVPAIKKMKPMLSEMKRDISSELSSQGTGDFYLVSGENPTAVHSDMSFVATRQMAEIEILRLARSRQLETVGGSTEY